MTASWGERRDMTRLDRLLLISSVISMLALLPAAGTRAEDDPKPKATTSKATTTPSHATPASPTVSAAPAKLPGTTSAKPDPSKPDSSKAQAGGTPAGGAGAIPGQVGNVLNTLNGFMSGFGH
jgi:hypothetical protein